MLRSSPIFTCWGQFRWIIMILSTFCLTLLMSNSIAFNFTVICMKKDDLSTSNSNSTLTSNSTQETEYMFTTSEQSWLFSMDPLGRIIGTMLVAYTMTWFDFRTTFTLCGAVSIFATLMTPFSAYTGFYLLLVIRFLQGAATGIAYPSLGSIPSQWSTIKANGMYISLLSCHLQLCNMFTMPIAGALCESSWGWPSLYYLQGGLSILLYVIFYATYRDDPYKHKFVNDKEALKITYGKSTRANSGNKSIPYRKLFTTRPILGNIISTTFLQIGFWLYVQFGPVYMNKVLGFDVRSTGVGAALPYIVCMVLKIIAGPLMDRAQCIGMNFNVTLLTIIASATFVICSIGMSFMNSDWLDIAQICYILAVAFAGLNGPASYKSAQLMAQHYAFVLIMASTITIGIIALILPIAVSILVPDNTQDQWRMVFIGSSVIMSIGVIIFGATVETKPIPWIQESGASEEKKAKIFESNLFSPNEEKIEKVLKF